MRPSASLCISCRRDRGGARCRRHGVQLTGQPGTGEGAPGVASVGNAVQTQPEPVPPKQSAAHYLWAVLIARIYEVFPLLCPMCGGQMRLIAFITEGAQTGKILDHIGVDSQAPRIAPARGPPLWEDCDAQGGEPARQGVTAGQVRVLKRNDDRSTVRYWAGCG